MPAWSVLKGKVKGTEARMLGKGERGIHAKWETEPAETGPVNGQSSCEMRFWYQPSEIYDPKEKTKWFCGQN